MYRSVEELNENELQELRSSLFDRMCFDGAIEDILTETIDKEINSAEEIPMDFVKTYYAGTIFVEEDFFCNLRE